MQNPIQDCVKIESLKKIDYFGKYNVWLFLQHIKSGHYHILLIFLFDGNEDLDKLST